MMKLWNSEPTAIVAVIQAGIVLAVTFGLRLSPEQIGAIVTFSGLVLALVNRSQVHSSASVEALKAKMEVKG